MRLCEELRFVAVASVALSLTACSSLTQPDTFQVDKDSVIAARPAPAPPEPPAEGSLPGAAVLPDGLGQPLRLPGAGQPAPRKQGG